MKILFAFILLLPLLSYGQAVDTVLLYDTDSTGYYIIEEPAAADAVDSTESHNDSTARVFIYVISSILPFIVLFILLKKLPRITIGAIIGGVIGLVVVAFMYFLTWGKLADRDGTVVLGFIILGGIIGFVTRKTRTGAENKKDSSLGMEEDEKVI